MTSFRKHKEFCDRCNGYVDVMFTFCDVSGVTMTKTVNTVCSNCYNKIKSTPNVAYRCDSV